YKSLVLNIKSSFQQANTADRKTVSYKQAQHIGVMIWNPDQQFNSTINFFIKELNDEGKLVQVIVYNTKKNPQAYDFPHHTFDLRDFDWKGDIKNQVIDKFIKTPFDYLYSINILPFLPFKFILQKSKAKCRIGKFEKEANLDFMIELGKDQHLDILLDQLIIYSKKLRTDE
ncbi:MAG: hypothetical protein K2X86_15725, partial [Cytophagaceae bacterium]|nr:hypothetical protein [Cytophagaceae bacterium]